MLRHTNILYWLISLNSWESFCIQLIILFYFIHSLLFQIWFAKNFQKKKKFLAQQRFSLITEAWTSRHLICFCIFGEMQAFLRSNTLQKKWSFPWRISSVNVTKSPGNCGFGHIYWRNRSWKTSFFSQYKLWKPLKL